MTCHICGNTTGPCEHMSSHLYPEDAMLTPDDAAYLKREVARLSQRRFEFGKFSDDATCDEANAIEDALMAWIDSHTERPPQ
jgi:hypothetical protein